MLPGRGAGRRDPLQPSPGEPAAGLRVARPRLARSLPARFLTAGTRRAGEPRGLEPLGRRTASLDFFFPGGILAVQSETVEMHNLQSKSFFIYALLCTGLFICKPSSLVWLGGRVCVSAGSVCAWVSAAWGEQMGD